MYLGIVFDDSDVTEERLLTEIERLLKKTFNMRSLSDAQLRERDMTQMFMLDLEEFSSYLKSEISPKI